MLSFVEATKLFAVTFVSGQKNNTELPFNQKMSFDWNKEKREINFLQNKKVFGRTDLVQEKYDQYLRNQTNLNPKNSDVAIKDRILNTELPINEDGVFGIENQVTLRKNNFPYDFGDNHHYVLWIHPNCSSTLKSKIFTPEGINRVIDRILADAPDELRNTDRIIFRNAPENKSVLLIEHFHVIFKKQ